MGLALSIIVCEGQSVYSLFSMNKHLPLFDAFRGIHKFKSEIGIDAFISVLDLSVTLKQDLYGASLEYTKPSEIKNNLEYLAQFTEIGAKFTSNGAVLMYLSTLPDTHSIYFIWH